MLALEKFDKDDYERLINWVDSEEALMQFAGPGLSFPLTKDQIEKSVDNPNRYVFKVVDTDTKTVIGHAEIYVKEGFASLGKILIGDHRMRGRGTGKQIVDNLLSYVFLILKQPGAELNVFDWNIAAIKCYTKSGFTINPDKKLERTVNGKTWIALNMTLSKEEWQQRKQTEWNNKT